MFQSYPRLLLERLEGLGVVMLSEVFEAKADGFLFSVLRRTIKFEFSLVIHTLLEESSKAL